MARPTDAASWIGGFAAHGTGTVATTQKGKVHCHAGKWFLTPFLFAFLEFIKIWRYPFVHQSQPSSWRYDLSLIVVREKLPALPYEFIFNRFA